MATKLTARDKRIFEAVHSAKRWIEEAISETIQMQFGHSQMLQAVNKYADTTWYKRVPEYRRYEVRGYKEALLSARYSPLNRHQKTALLFRGKLYRSFDEWRSAFPELPGSELQDANVVAWKPSGKIYSGPTGTEGQTFEWYTPME